MRSVIGLLLAALLLTGAGAARAQSPTAPEAPPPRLPMRIGVLPFRCGTPCDAMAELEQGLVERLVEDSTFSVIADVQTEQIYVDPPQYRRVFDALTEQASSGHAPDSATAAQLMRRLPVDGFLYGYMGAQGPVVEIWAARPKAGVVFHYASQTEAQIGDVLPEAPRADASSRGAIPMTGGASTSQSSGSGGGPSKTSGKSTDPVSTLKTDTDDTRQVSIRGSVDDRTRDLIGAISDRLKKRHRAESRGSSG